MNPLGTIPRPSVLGDGLALSHDMDGRLVLHEFVGGQSRRLGSYASAADAWRAIDAIDLGDDLSLSA
jgi:hypothetical protein